MPIKKIAYLDDHPAHNNAGKSRSRCPFTSILQRLPKGCQQNERFLEEIQRNDLQELKYAKWKREGNSEKLHLTRYRKINYPNTDLEELDNWSSEWQHRQIKLEIPQKALTLQFMNCCFFPSAKRKEIIKNFQGLYDVYTERFYTS